MIEMFSYFIIVMNFEYDIFSHFRVAIPAIPATFLKKGKWSKRGKGDWKHALSYPRNLAPGKARFCKLRNIHSTPEQRVTNTIAFFGGGGVAKLNLELVSRGLNRPGPLTAALVLSDLASNRVEAQARRFRDSRATERERESRNRVEEFLPEIQWQRNSKVWFGTEIHENTKVSKVCSRENSSNGSLFLEKRRVVGQVARGRQCRLVLAGNSEPPRERLLSLFCSFRVRPIPVSFVSGLRPAGST